MFYMVSPTGKIYDVEVSHDVWAQRNYELIGISRDEASRIYHDGMTSLVEMFIKDDWIRVHMRGEDLNFEVKNYSNSVFSRIRSIIDRTIEYSSYGKYVIVSLVDSYDSKEFPMDRFMYVTASKKGLSMR